LLTEAVHKNPYGVLLLDEIEKAHPDITNILLQVMDAGRLTDSNGRVADFKNVILVMTSNAGAMETSRGTISIMEDDRSSLSMDAIKKSFSPEFINRLDAVVSFQGLNEDMVMKITQKFIDELKMVLIEKKVEMNVSQDVVRWLMKKGYDKVYGARPLARVIDEQLKKSLVDELLFGRLAEGGRISVELEKETLKFHFSTTQNGSLGQKNQKLPVTT